MVLTNTTLGQALAAVNQTIITITLPAVFAGLHVDPLQPEGTRLLLWLTLGYSAATTVFLVTFGRLGDMYGRSRVYALGLVLFTGGALLSALTPSSGDAGMIELIAFRIVQGAGGACIFANSVALLVDSFPPYQRGLAIGINQLAFVGGSLVGVVAGGALAAVEWRLVFLASVPLGTFASIWALLRLRDAGPPSGEPPDWLGGVAFGSGLIALLYGLTEALTPYGGQALGWTNPVVIGSLVGGTALLGVFVWIETRVRHPMFRLQLFAIRLFALGNGAAFLFALARGGIQFLLIIWLQAVWLPLHGVSYARTPLLAGAYTLPLILGFSLAAPVGGWLSDRHGNRALAFAGSLLVLAGSAALTTLPADFPLLPFCLLQFPIGVGVGIFAGPNTVMVLSQIPAAHRGAAAGMRATVWNAGLTASQAVFFTLLVGRLTQVLPPAVERGLTAAGVPPSTAAAAAALPAGSAIFAALVGQDPLGRLLSPAQLAALPAGVASRIQAPHFFAGLLAAPFGDGVHAALVASMVICLVSATASLAMGVRPPAGRRAPISDYPDKRGK